MSLIGSTLPRLWTPPLPGRQEGGGCVEGCGCGLDGGTSRGFEVVEWAGRMGWGLFPWQRWLLVHALELDEQCDRHRFRTVLTLVARQNGKTHVKMVLTLWRMFEQQARLCVGTAQERSQAKEVAFEGLVPMILDSPLSARFDPDGRVTGERRGVWHKTLGEEYFRIDDEDGRPGPRYLIKTLNRGAGRGLWGVAEVNIDETREQTDFAGWSAVSKTTMAAEDAQVWCMSNAGDSRSVVLNHLRGIGIAGTDPALFLAEWSAPDKAELGDRDGQAQANPSLGYPGGVTEAAIASAAGSDPPSVFRTEVLCQFVDVLNSAVDPSAWEAGADPLGGSSGEMRPTLGVEAAVEGDQVVAVSASPLDDGRVRLDVVGVWDGTDAARHGLDELRSVLRPSAIGWYPKGPGSRLSAAMRKRGGVEIKSTAVAEAHMTFADWVDARRIVHDGDRILDAHARQTGMVGSAASWVFDRGPGATHAMWAAAAALHLALNSETPREGRRTIIVPDEDEG